MKLCSKYFRQQPIKYMVALIDYNAAVVEFVCIGQPPPLLPLCQLYYRCSLSYASIEHMILYLSILALIINPSNTFPYNFLQIDVLCHGPPVIQS